MFIAGSCTIFECIDTDKVAGFHSFFFQRLNNICTEVLKNLVKQVFIGHNEKPWIAWQLEEAGYTTVLQAWDFRPGSNFVLEMQKAASTCERTIMVLSRAYLDAVYTQPEWAAAFAQDPEGSKRTLLPVRVERCEPEGMLKPIVYIDLVGMDEQAARDVLLEGIQTGRIKPDTAPVFPVTEERPEAERPRFPGSLPPIWNIPHRRNPNFTGREALLEQLERELSSGRPMAVTQAISGLGGVGKTQLSVEYAYRCVSRYKVVWWVRAEETVTLSSDFAGLAEPLALPERESTEQGAIVEAVCRWLNRNPGWLLIFDNATGPDSLCRYLPQSAAGHVIITSRNQVWRDVANPLSVEVWDRPESVQFLMRRTGCDDCHGAAELAGELGDLPLALEQAGAYIDETGETFSGYL